MEPTIPLEPGKPEMRIGPWTAGLDLASVLSRVELRTVPKTTPCVGGAAYQIRRSDIGGGMRGQQVAIEQRLDQTLWMRWKQRRLPLDRCAAVKKPNYHLPWTPLWRRKNPTPPNDYAAASNSALAITTLANRCASDPCGRPSA